MKKRFGLGRVLLLSVVTVLVAGNASIYLATLWAKAQEPRGTGFELPGVTNFEAVDHKLWRGAAPTLEGYETLAAKGVETVIDLRVEGSTKGEVRTLERLGVELVRITMRDGQAPTKDQVQRFLRVVAASDGRVFVHCGAGVGRTGTMAAAYLVSTGAATPSEAVVRNLAVGPPSLEQLAFVDGMNDGSFGRPPLAVTALSRFLDAPRRLLVRLGI